MWWPFSVCLLISKLHLTDKQNTKQNKKNVKNPLFPASFLLVEVCCPVAKLPLLKDSTLGNGSYLRTSNEHPIKHFLCNLVRVCSGLKKVGR